MFYAYIFKNLEGNHILSIELSRFFFKKNNTRTSWVKVLQIFPMNLAEIIFWLIPLLQPYTNTFIGNSINLRILSKSCLIFLINGYNVWLLFYQWRNLICQWTFCFRTTLSRCYCFILSVVCNNFSNFKKND